MPRKVYRAKYSGKIYNTREEAIRDNAAYLTAEKLSEQTKNIPVTYIGGKTNEEVRNKFWNQEPVLMHAIDSVANLYGVNPKALKYRIEHEGFVDHHIQNRNGLVLQGHADDVPRGYKILNDYVGLHEGTNNFGLDDAGSMFENGDIKLKGKKWYKYSNGYEYKEPIYYTYNWVNEPGRTTNAATGADVADNFGITAAILKNKKDKAAKDFPNMSNKDLDRASVIYFHRGDTGGKKYIQNGGTGYNFKYGGQVSAPKEKEPVSNTAPDMRWHQWWLNNRTDQLGRNIMETEIHPIWAAQQLIGRGFPGYSAIGKERVSEQINNAKGYTEYVGGNSVPKKKYNLMSRAYPSSKGMSQEEFFQRKGVLGSTYPALASIVYPDEWAAGKAKTHERTHALNTAPQQNKIRMLLSKYYSGAKLDNYIDDPDEIYARLMDFRKTYNLDPKKKVTKKDLEDWRKKEYGTKIYSNGNYVIDRYDDDFLIELFNNVASNDYNPVSQDIMIAKYGGQIRRRLSNAGKLGE